MAYWPSVLEGSYVSLWYLGTILEPTCCIEDVRSDLEARVERRRAHGPWFSPWPSFDRFRCQTDYERDLFVQLLRIVSYFSLRQPRWLELLVDVVSRPQQSPADLMALRSVAMRGTELIEEERSLASVADADDVSDSERTLRLMRADCARDEVRELEPELEAIVLSSGQTEHGPLFTRPSS